MSQRLTRVSELMKQELSTLLTKEFDFGDILVTVNQVDLTPDLKQGHVYLGFIGSPSKQNKVLHQLNKKHTHIQQQLSKRVVLKFTPHLHFKHDSSVQEGVNLVNLLNQIEQDLPPETPTENTD